MKITKTSDTQARITGVDPKKAKAALKKAKIEMEGGDYIFRSGGLLVRIRLDFQEDYIDATIVHKPFGVPSWLIWQEAEKKLNALPTE